MSNTDVKSVIKEARNVFDEVKESGEFDAALNNKKCPYCGEAVKPGQKFCSVYGKPLG